MPWSAGVQALERVIPIAKHLLTIPVDPEHGDLWLWERAERVTGLTQLIAKLPELAGQTMDLVALGAAGLFHCAGWAAQVQEGRITRGQVLGRPTNEIQRELAAALLQEHAGPLLGPKTVRLAAEAIRQSHDRATPLLEAQVLAEAESLDDLGVLYVLRQFRLYQAESRPLRQLLATWRRQEEYRYWELRVNEGLRFEATRRLARTRLEAVGAFMRALARDLDGTDISQALSNGGPEGAPRPSEPERARGVSRS